MDAEEHVRVVEITLEEARGKVPVIAGAGGNNTRRVCEQVRRMESLGVDGILSVSPYYNKPTQEGIFQHYRAVAQATTLPVIVYNVPGRTGSNIEPATLVRLAEIPNILGVKEASGNIAQIGQILRLFPPRFRVVSGDDAMTLPIMALGACGLISVAANVIPREMQELVSLCGRGDFGAARRLYFRLLPLMQALFIESSPIPVKAALAALGLIQPIYRLPLVPMQPETHARLMKVLEDLDLLSVPSPAAGRERKSNMQLAELIERLFEQQTTTYGPEFFEAFEQLKEGLNRGEVRAAEPDEASAVGWKVNAWVKKGILLGFRIGRLENRSVDGKLPFFDKHTYPLKKLAADSGVRIVPGGSSIRDACYVGRGVTCMPPMYINAGAYVDDGTMIDSHALVGSCAQIGKRVHLSAASQIGGVLEPAGALPSSSRMKSWSGATAESTKERSSRSGPCSGPEQS